MYPKKSLLKKLLHLMAVALMFCLIGCCRTPSESATVAEGVILYVEYQKEGGGVQGFSRVNHPSAVPGGNGSWNVDAYGKLTGDYLIITRPQRQDLGPKIIPADRLISIQFGDGGIKQVDENKPNHSS